MWVYVCVCTIWAVDSRTCVCIGPDTDTRKVHDGFWRAVKICGLADLLCIPTQARVRSYFTHTRVHRKCGCRCRNSLSPQGGAAYIRESGGESGVFRTLSVPARSLFCSHTHGVRNAFKTTQTPPTLWLVVTVHHVYIQYIRIDICLALSPLVYTIYRIYFFPTLGQQIPLSLHPNPRSTIADLYVINPLPSPSAYS